MQFSQTVPPGSTNEIALSAKFVELFSKTLSDQFKRSRNLGNWSNKNLENEMVHTVTDYDSKKFTNRLSLSARLDSYMASAETATKQVGVNVVVSDFGWVRPGCSLCMLYFVHLEKPLFGEKNL